MAKKKNILKKIKLQIPAGQANPAPPIGPALGQAGINIMEFCQAFNAKTKDQSGNILSVALKVYEDRSFDFEIKSPPTSTLIKKALNLEKGASLPKKDTAGSLTKDQIKEIAKIKLPDINAYNLESAIKMVVGTAKSMGVKVEE